MSKNDLNMNPQDGQIPCGAETTLEDGLCVIIVHGLVPEFMPGVAFRRDKHYKTAKKKVIKCPYCKEVFKVVEVTAKLELIRYPKKDQKKVPWHQSMPCQICRNEVGVIYHAA